MARKINLNSSEIYQKLGSPSISPKSTVEIFFSQDKRKSVSQEHSPHVQSPDFSKQLPRTEMRQFSPNVHEKRFVAFQNFPIVSSRVPRIPVPDISRTTGRNFMSIYNKTQVQKDYSPNYQTVWKGSGKQLLKFDATLGRKPLYKPKEFNFNSTDINYKQVDANLAVPNIEKTSSRPDEQKVPSFMVGVHYLGRVPGHNMVNFKSLKMNNFMNTTFMPLKSSFGELTYKSKSVMRPSKDLSSLSNYDNY